MVLCTCWRFSSGVGLGWDIKLHVHWRTLHILYNNFDKIFRRCVFYWVCILYVCVYVYIYIYMVPACNPTPRPVMVMVPHPAPGMGGSLVWMYACMHACMCVGR